jgi:hypothetical protein
MASIERTKKPPKLELKPPPEDDPAASLRTPKEIATDIALQCVSPAIPSFVNNGAVQISKSIEAQQRKLIAERSMKTDVSTPKSPGFSRGTWRRAPRPADIVITSHMKNQHPRIYSAPLHMHTPLSGPEEQKVTISGDIYHRKGSVDNVKTARAGYNSKWGELELPDVSRHGEELSSGSLLSASSRASKRSKRSRDSPTDQNSPPSSAADDPYDSNEGTGEWSRSSGRPNYHSGLDQRERHDSSDEEDDERDPEEAALSDNEKEGIEQKNKRSYTISEEDFEQRGREELRRRRKMKFMGLCGEIWDLLHEGL